MPAEPSGGRISDPKPLWKIFAKNKQRAADVEKTAVSSWPLAISQTRIHSREYKFNAKKAF